MLDGKASTTGILGPCLGGLLEGAEPKPEHVKPRFVAPPSPLEHLKKELWLSQNAPLEPLVEHPFGAAPAGVAGGAGARAAPNMP